MMDDPNESTNMHTRNRSGSSEQPSVHPQLGTPSPPTSYQTPRMTHSRTGSNRSNRYANNVYPNIAPSTLSPEYDTNSSRRRSSSASMAYATSPPSQHSNSHTSLPAGFHPHMTGDPYNAHSTAQQADYTSVRGMGYAGPLYAFPGPTHPPSRDLQSNLQHGQYNRGAYNNSRPDIYYSDGM